MIEITCREKIWARIESVMEKKEIIVRINKKGNQQKNDIISFIMSDTIINHTPSTALISYFGMKFVLIFVHNPNYVQFFNI